MEIKDIATYSKAFKHSIEFRVQGELEHGETFTGNLEIPGELPVNKILEIGNIFKECLLKVEQIYREI